VKIKQNIYYDGLSFSIAKNHHEFTLEYMKTELQINAFIISRFAVNQELI